jgi:CrcB protein
VGFRYALAMFAYLCVALGGALGSMGRYWVFNLISQRYGTEFPLGTLVINVTGSFVIGVFFALYQPGGHFEGSQPFRQLFMVGICGGYTTFSSFSLETLREIQKRQWLYAGGNVILSVTLCMIAVGLGYLAGGLLNLTKGK